MATGTIEKHGLYAPESMSNVDITAFTQQSGNKYVCPTDGYAWINAQSGKSASLQIYAKDGDTSTYVLAKDASVQAVLVLKGMQLSVSGNFSGARFIKFN